MLFSAVPFGFEPWGFTAWWFEGGGRELALEIYAGIDVVPVLCGLIGPETAGWFRSELRDLDDLRGLKIRFAGLGGKVLQTLGASVTMLLRSVPRQNEPGSAMHCQVALWASRRFSLNRVLGGYIR